MHAHAGERSGDVVISFATPTACRRYKMPIRSLCITEGADRPTVETFIGLHRANIDLKVVCPEDHPNHRLLAGAGVPTIDIRLRRNFDKEGSAALRKELIQGRYHIMHTFNSRAVTNGLRASRGMPTRVVCYRGIVGNVSFLDPMSWMRYLNPRIDRIVCVCEAIREYFLNMRPKFLRMPEERPVTIHKGHRLDWYTAPPAERSTLGLPEDAFVIACAASYRPRKGVEYLVEAMAMLPRDIPAHLLLIGHMDAPKLSAKIAKNPARERIHRVGFRKDAPALSGTADVFCLPSTKREGLPRAVIEAMAYGVPPVVTDCGGNPELVVDGESGFVVPVKDAAALSAAFETLFRNPTQRERMGIEARNRIANSFRTEDTIAKTIALYEELVPNPQ